MEICEGCGNPVDQHVFTICPVDNRVPINAFDVLRRHYGGYEWECTCGLRGSMSCMDMDKVIVDARSHQCLGSNKRAIYIQDV